MRDLLTPKQVARAIGASEASLKRWCDKGLVPTIRTAGGHRRLPLSGVIQFIREHGHPIVRTEVLGLPSSAGKGESTIERARAPMRAALESGDEERFFRLVFDLYLAGRSAVEICDKAIAPAFHGIGERWEHGELEVFEERRACEICMRVLRQLRRILPPPAADAPVAIGGTLPGDPYTIPTTMVEVALREAGWRADSYGTNLPFKTFAVAMERVRPRLFWLSVSSFASRQEFLDAYAKLYAKGLELGIAVAVGGKTLTEDLRQELQYSAHCDTLKDLVSFARTLTMAEAALRSAAAASSRLECTGGSSGGQSEVSSPSPGHK